MTESYCEIHPLYFPAEGPPKGFRSGCTKCLWIYFRQVEKDFLKSVTEAEHMRPLVEAMGDNALTKRYDRLIAVMKGEDLSEF